MKSLLLNSTSDTPSITFDIDKNIFEITGKSLPENAPMFYKPVYDWIVEFTEQHINRGIELNINLEYLNSSSIKLVFFIFNKLNEYHINTEAKNKTFINWYYNADDELTKTKGEEFKALLKSIPLHVKAIG